MIGGEDVSQNIFKIYGGRTNFWQWDTKQKLIVLDEKVKQVHFSNRGMNHSIKRTVYDYEGMRVCDVPSMLLQLPYNLVAYAYADGYTVKSVKFAVVQRPIPVDYIADKKEDINEIERRLEILENVLKDIAQSGATNRIQKFDNMVDAAKWAAAEKAAGEIVAIRIDGRWLAHMVEDDYSITPICNCEGDPVEIRVFDGGDADGYDENEVINEVTVWDGGNAAGY